MYIWLFTCMMLRFCFYNMLTRMVFALTYRQFNLEASSCFAIQQLFLVDMTTDFGSLEFDDQDSRYVLNIFVTVFDHFAVNCPISPASRHFWHLMIFPNLPFNGGSHVFVVPWGLVRIFQHEVLDSSNSSSWQVDHSIDVSGSLKRW